VGLTCADVYATLNYVPSTVVNVSQRLLSVSFSASFSSALTHTRAHVQGWVQPWQGRQVAKVRWGHVASKGALLSGALLLSMHYLRAAGPVRYETAHPFAPIGPRSSV